MLLAAVMLLDGYEVDEQRLAKCQALNASGLQGVCTRPLLGPYSASSLYSPDRRAKAARNRTRTHVVLPTDAGWTPERREAQRQRMRAWRRKNPDVVKAHAKKYAAERRSEKARLRADRRRRMLGQEV